MPKMIFVNLAVADVEKSAAFYEAVGFTKDQRFSRPGSAAAMTWSDTIAFMLLSLEHFAKFTSKTIIDAHSSVEALLCLSRDSRAEVDAIVEAARAAGANAAGTEIDHKSLIPESEADRRRFAFRPLAGIHRPERHHDRRSRQGQRRIMQRRAGCPAPQFLQYDFGFIAPGGQLIDLDGCRRRQLSPLDDADALQTFQPPRENIRADAGQAGSQLGETPPPEHQLAHDQE